MLTQEKKKSNSTKKLPLVALYIDSPIFKETTPATEETKTTLPAPEAFRRG